jgi:hypothetical protein
MSMPLASQQRHRGNISKSMLLFVLSMLAMIYAPHARAQQQVTGAPAVQLLLTRKQFAAAEKMSYQLLWSDMHQPQVIGLLAQALEAQKRPDEAAVWYTLMLRAAAESDLPKADVAKYKAAGERRLALLNKEWDKQKAAHEKSAAGRKFETPEQVSDGWLTLANFELKQLHGLYGYKFIGGRKDKPADWVHNAKGEIHRAGCKLVDELDGRKGVAFCCFNPKLMPTAQRPLINRIALPNVGGGRYLRIGTKGYNFPFGMTVTAGEREVLTKTIAAKQWDDLKIDLGEAPTKGEQITITLFHPTGKGPFEGCWFDYIDFFEN